MRKKPDILDTRTVAKSNLFTIEQLDLLFSNGEQRCYERIVGVHTAAVMIAAIDDKDQIFLVREYNVGLHRYEIGLPKGALEAGENPIIAANRELMEEVGYGANQLQLLKPMTTAPGFMCGELYLVLAEDLFEKRLPGDEPEELDVITWPMSDINSLLMREDFTEARSIAGLLMIQHILNQRRQP